MLKIIGYGNPFRRDDAIGIWVISRLKYIWAPPKDMVDFWMGQQLVPELALWIQDADRVIFIDSSLKTHEEKGWEFIEIRGGKRALTDNMFHSMDVGSLLTLSKREYGRVPRAWLLAITGYDFSFGAGLTDKARKAAKEAIEFVKGFALNP